MLPSPVSPTNPVINSRRRAPVKRPCKTRGEEHYTVTDARTSLDLWNLRA